MTAYPKAVIFDLDGCLVDSEPLSIEAITAEMRDMGIADASFTEIRDQFLGVSMRKISEYVAGKCGADVDPDFIDRVEARIFDSQINRLRRLDGVVDMLTELRARGVATAIATGGSIRRMKKTLEISELMGWFEDRAFSADQVARGKPAPDLFLFAAQQLGVRPQDCVVLEDSPHGVQGGVAAGMVVIGFVGGSHLDGIRSTHAELLKTQGAHVVAQTLEEVTGYFQMIGGPER